MSQVFVISEAPEHVPHVGHEVLEDAEATEHVPHGEHEVLEDDGQLDPECEKFKEVIRSTWGTIKVAAQELDVYARCHVSSSRWEDDTLKFVCHFESEAYTVPSRDTKVFLERFHKVSTTGGAYATQLEALLEGYTKIFLEDHGDFNVDDGLLFSELSMDGFLQEYHDYAYMMDLWMTWAELKWIIDQDAIKAIEDEQYRNKFGSYKNKTFKSLKSQFQEQYTHWKNLSNMKSPWQLAYTQEWNHKMGYKFLKVGEENEVLRHIYRNLSDLRNSTIFLTLETKIGEDVLTGVRIPISA